MGCVRTMFKRLRDMVGVLRWFFGRGDLGLVGESGDRVKAGFKLTQDIRQLEGLGFHVFGASENREYEVSDRAINLSVAVIRIIRKDNAGIFNLDGGRGSAESQEE